MTRLREGTRFYAAWVVALLLAATIEAVLSAHAGSVAYWRVTFGPDAATSQVLIALEDASRWAPHLSTGSGDVPVARLGTLGPAVVRHFAVTRDGEAVPSQLLDARVLASGLLEMRLTHRVARSDRHIALRSTFHQLTDDTHRVIARVDGFGEERALVFHAAAAAQELKDSRPALQHRKASAVSTVEMLRLGVDHILRGFDHLVFLACLLVSGGTWRSRVAIVSAFTVAHSLTLVMAATRIVTVPAGFVEPAIALSIAYVAVENLFGDVGRSRWPTAFGFGLVHGLGFAGQLDVIGLPLGEWLTAVLAFNVGVEIGQLAVVAIVLPIVFAMARSVWHRRLVQCTSVLVLGLAVVWFVDRLP